MIHHTCQVQAVDDFGREFPACGQPGTFMVANVYFCNHERNREPMYACFQHALMAAAGPGHWHCIDCESCVIPLAVLSLN